MSTSVSSENSHHRQNKFTAGESGKQDTAAKMLWQTVQRLLVGKLSVALTSLVQMVGFMGVLQNLHCCFFRVL